MTQPSWLNSVVLGPEDLLIVRYRDGYVPTHQEAVDLAAGVPTHLRKRVVVFLQPVELEKVTVEQRPLLVAQLKELVSRLEGVDVEQPPST